MTGETSSKRCDCPSCGATLLFAAELQKLKCDYCGAEVEVGQASQPSSSVRERTLEELWAHDGQQGLGADTTALHCQQCGASINYPDKVTSGSCCFCGSSTVIERPSTAQLIRPESLIPFKVHREQASQKFRSWVASLWFRPNDLKQQAWVKEIEGVYCPFWTFDAQADTRWQAESGYYYMVSEEVTTSEGKREVRQVQKTRWEPASGQHLGRYDDLLVCASKGLPSSLIRSLEPFHTDQGLVAYKASYLSGWGAEEYAIGPKEAWELGQTRFEEQEYQACAREVPGDTQRNLRIAMKLSQVTWKHCLLPVYLAAYRYQGQTYRFLVNGETGKVSGEAPYSLWKILFALAVLAILIYFVWRYAR